VDRPYVLLSCAISLDGYLDDASAERLVLSGPGDLDQVDELRAGSDAILVGAETIRADNPRLLLRSGTRRAARLAQGLTPDPVKVAVTASGRLDPAARFFTTGETAKLVYAASPVAPTLAASLGAAATVVDAGDPAELTAVLADLARRGIGRLMVEGGRSILTQFLVSGLADTLRLAIAPIFVGDEAAPRFTGAGSFPWRPGHPARLVQVDRADADAILTYALSDRHLTPPPHPTPPPRPHTAL
jgi:5-amino-6-(5-phosphoribosylamino)uracil reductase